MEIISDELNIAKLYKEFSKTADELADTDVKNYPLDKNETKRDRYEKHLIGMIEMYISRFGDNKDFNDDDPMDTNFLNQN